MPPQIKTLTASILESAASFGGNNSPSIFRGQNAVLRGANTDRPFFEAFGGNKDLNENFNLDTANYKLSGTLSFTAGLAIVTGTLTNFISELHIGQLILSGAEVFSVKEVMSDTSFTSHRTSQTTAAAQIGFRQPQLSEMSGKRVAMLSGNAIQTERGSIIAIGSGVMYVNGQPLAGTSLTAGNFPQVAIYRPITDDYAVAPLGFSSVPPPPVINVVAGGTKGMVAGNKHSFMISYWSPPPGGTDGYSNPCEVIKKDGAAADITITLTLNRFEIDFTASLVGLPANAAGFIVWKSLDGKKSVSISGATTTTTSPNQTNFENGAWYRVKKIKIADLVANKFTFDVLDSEIFEEVTGNNDSPPSCEFVAKFENKPMYISAYGKRRVSGSDKGSNPGPNVLLSKFANPDAAPSDWAASVSRNIIGWFEGVGRWFLMTESTLEFAFATGLFGNSQAGGLALEIPIATRPYWRTGAYNRYSMTMVDDTIYGFSGNKFFQSIGSGDENIKKYDFGAKVEDLTRKMNGGYVYVAVDSKNTQICLVHSAAYKNANGFWVTEILPFSMFANAWMPKIVLSKPDRDQIVSGVATVNERFEFLCGGRVAGGTFQTKTYRYDGFDEGEQPGVSSGQAFVIWQLSDDGLEDMSKMTHWIKLTGKLTNPVIQFHGTRPGGNFSIENMENGTNSLSGNITFATSSANTRYLQKNVKIKNLATYAIRLNFEWNGTGEKDRLDEIAIAISAHGRKR